MKKFIKIKDSFWEKYRGITHEQRYFIYRWFELLNANIMSFDSIPVYGIRGQLKEFLSVHELVISGNFDKKHICDVIRDIQSSFKANLIIRTSKFKVEREILNSKFSEALSLFDKRDDEKGFLLLKEIRKLVSSFSKKLDNINFINVHIDILCEVLKKERIIYDSIDNVSVSLLSELLYEGHSRRYLYTWGLANFLHSTEPNFFTRLNEIKKLGKKNKRLFRVYFKVTLPKLRIYDEFSSTEIRLFKDDYRVGEDENDDITEINNLLNDTTVDKAVVNVSALDTFSALELAREKITSVLLLSNLMENTQLYNPNIGNEVVVLDLSSRRIEKVKFEDFGSSIRIANLVSYFSKSLSEESEINQETKDSLSRALHWCRIANYSPEESRFLALWGVIEFLLSAHSNKIIQPIVECFIPFSGAYFVKKYVYQIQTIMENDSNEKYSQLKANVLREYNQPDLRLGEFLEYIYKNTDKVIEKFDSNDLLTRKVRWLAGSLNERKLLYSAIRNLEHKVTADLFRMYRLRNMLAHRAHVGEETLEANLRWLVFYLQIVIDNILFIYGRRPEHTIEEILMAKRLSYESYKKNLSNYIFPSVDFKDVVLPHESFI